MKVVLDTNIILDDYNLKKPFSLIFLRELKEGKLSLHIPEIVFDEVMNKFRQRIEKAHKDIKSELDTVADLAAELLENPLSEAIVNQLMESYEARLKKLFAD